MTAIEGVIVKPTISPDTGEISRTIVLNTEFDIFMCNLQTLNPRE